MVKFDVMTHKLVPKHILLSESEKQEVIDKYKVDPYQFPKIFVSDPCARALGAKPGDIIKILRESQTAGTTVAYRLVIED
jgi:DNA-directed RNA polymerase subunit H